MEISRECVCFFNITFRCFFFVFHTAHVSACSGVIGSVCVPSCKDEGAWLVNLARPKWLDVNAQRLQIGLQNSPPVVDVTQ